MSTDKSILIVDDNWQLRELVKMTLTFSHYKLHEAETGQDALQLIKAIKPGIVLLDIMMPGELSGLDVCREIKSDPNLSHIRVIILSAKGQKVDLEAGGQAGADAYFVKPFSPLSLLDSIQSVTVS
jgi:DNA-binding response OmpR family regulator